MIENLGLARLRLGDERLIQNIQNILAHFFELSFNLLAVITDDVDVLGRALGLFLLLD